MKNIYKKYKSEKPGIVTESLWRFLQQWLRLLILSLTKTREKLPDKFFHSPAISRTGMLNIKPTFQTYITPQTKKRT